MYIVCFLCVLGKWQKKFYFKQKTAYDIHESLVGSEMCIRDSIREGSGAMARLGTRTPGGTTYDLHQGDLIVDEGAVRAGTRLLTLAAAGEWTRVDDPA